MQIVGAHGKASDTEDMHEPLPSRTGLSQAQAQAMLQEHGPNALDTEPRRSLATRLLDMVREPMFVLLVAAAALYIALGDRLEGVTLSLFVLAMLGLTPLPASAWAVAALTSLVGVGMAAMAWRVRTAR